MKARGIRLQYSFEAAGQQGPAVENPLFDLLQAVYEQGSIQRAAASLGLSYRHVWGRLRHWEAALGEALVHWTQGQPARLTPFAERLLWAERQARARLAPHIEALRDGLRRVLDEAFDGHQQLLRVDASHDLALPTLTTLAREHHGLLVELRFAGSLDALRSLALGRCTVAGFHVPTGLKRNEHYARAIRPLLKPGRHKLIGGMRRTQGLIVAPGNPRAVTTLPEVAARRGRRLRFVGRESGSGTALLCEHLLVQAGLAPDALAPHAVENSHLAAAQRIAAGQGDVALGLRAAADALGLGFVPLVQEDYFLVCLADVLETPAVRALRDALA